MLVKQHESNSPKVENEYSRIVKPEGNVVAQRMVVDVFEPRDDYWRGFGVLKDSGLSIREKYKNHDAEYIFDVKVEPTREDKGCICGEILKGLKSPQDCKLFGKACNPSDPVGACMVSTEGACYAHFRYRI
jgi:hydrogenase expression/formation protein HypD